MQTTAALLFRDPIAGGPNVLETIRAVATSPCCKSRNKLAERLAAVGHATYAIDLRGRGKSDGERFYVDKFVDYVKALVATAVDTAEPADVTAFDPPPTSDTTEPVATQ